MTRGLISMLLLALLLATTARAQESTSIMVMGEVDHPGEINFEGSPRLADAVKAAQVKREAYVLGAAWLRPSQQAEQTRLKAGLLYELAAIATQASGNGQEPLASLARRTHEWVGNMPVTGRQDVRTLEPHALQVSAPDNLPVVEGDRLFYPSRPQTVAVVGAVEQACDLPQVGLKDARSYLAQCAVSRFADSDVVFVIEPDGKVFVQGIALWNRSPAMPVAPGAVLYVPFGKRAIAHVADADFNREMAEFIATQPVGGSGMKP